MVMKTKLLIVLLVGLALPQIALAVWWNPFTWKIFGPKIEVVNKQVIETVIATTTTATTSVVTLEDLSKKIEELEKQLKESKQPEPEIKKEIVNVVKTETVKPVSAAQTQTGVLSEKEIIAKVKPAVVFISSSGGSGSGSIIDSSGHVLTNAHVVIGQEGLSVTLAGGEEKSARLVGIDENHDLAVLKISGAGIFPYVKINYSSGIEQGDKAYVFGYPLGFVGDRGAVSFIDGVVSRTFSDYIEVTNEFKPGNSGGALVNNRAELVGVPAQALCEIKKGISNCLKFAINISNVKDVIPKLLDGMMLYKNRESTSLERTIRSELARIYENTNESISLDKAISDSRDSNLFDYYNSQLYSNFSSNLVKNYVDKLVVATENMISAFDSLKGQSENLSTFFENNRDKFGSLGNYQIKTLNRLEAENKLKLKEYSSKANGWYSKKIEYDGLIGKTSSVTKEYLLQQDAFLKSAIEYLISERVGIMKSFSGEVIDIF